jgi:hypothetical protein
MPNAISIKPTIDPAQIEKEITYLLEQAPAFGSIGIQLFFHDARLVRIERSRSEMLKP